MNPLHHFDIAELLPDSGEVFQHQGIPKGTSIPERIDDLFSEAVSMFSHTARPVGLMEELSKGEFDSVFRGEGKNEEEAPLEQIFPQSDHVALFACTMGATISSTIEQLFAMSNFALGSMLDAVTSLAADQSVEILEIRYREYLELERAIPADHYVLGYSPGYCGWDISGQRKLFEALRPDRIDIQLNDSYLMTPLKSVTGVLVAGRREIHIFKPRFSFCQTCKTFSCRDRLKELHLPINPG